MCNKKYLQKAVFLDRDGVICEDTDYVTSFDKLRIYPYAREAIELIHKKGYLAIVITNQSGVARGMMTEDTLLQINEYLKEETGVDAIYYCPHLPPEGEEIHPYRIFCNCRKPDSGLIEQAIADYKIDREKSYMVGDRETDIMAGKKAGLKTVWIKSKYNTERADCSKENLLDFTLNLQ